MSKKNVLSQFDNIQLTQAEKNTILRVTREVKSGKSVRRAKKDNGLHVPTPVSLPFVAVSCAVLLLVFIGLGLFININSNFIGFSVSDIAELYGIKNAKGFNGGTLQICYAAENNGETVCWMGCYEFDDNGQNAVMEYYIFTQEGYVRSVESLNNISFDNTTTVNGICVKYSVTTTAYNSVYKLNYSEGGNSYYVIITSLRQDGLRDYIEIVVNSISI